MKMKKYPIVVLCITLLLILASLVLTFVGAFLGEAGDAYWKTGLAGLLIVPPLGWLMVVVYNRVHKDEQAVNDMMKRGNGGKTGQDAEADASDDAKADAPEDIEDRG